MSVTIRFSTHLYPRNPYDSSQNLSKLSQIYSFPSFKPASSVTKLLGWSNKFHVIRNQILKPTAYIGEGSLQHLDDPPLLVELEPVCSETQFDRVIAEAQQLDEPVIIVWMASWCRKCIYLKPKLEKLAADYHPRLRFYCVDVNAVPHKLVARAGVTPWEFCDPINPMVCAAQSRNNKMPTIQLWKDGKQQAEVIGGHKAYLVVNEVREMIQNELQE